MNIISSLVIVMMCSSCQYEHLGDFSIPVQQKYYFEEGKNNSRQINIYHTTIISKERFFYFFYLNVFHC